MRKYLIGSGIIGVVTSGISMLRGSDDVAFTWRAALAWLTWAISLALAIGAIVDIRRARHGRGELVALDSPIADRLQKYERPAG